MSHIENDPQFESLTVNNGVKQPPLVNPYLKIKKLPTFTVSDYVEGILKGDITFLSKAITMIESSKYEHQVVAQEILEKCLPYSGNSIRLGITGVPGAGKSTFIESLGKYVVGQNKKLAVLAIDPSSDLSKGSILGDKTRMSELSTEKNAFIRPSPSAGSLGGVARKTRETIFLCEAAGYETIFVETVGVGQSETAVHSMVDFFLLIQLAGTGDELQGIKRGIMEMADGIIINKADGNNIHKAKLAQAQFKNALRLFPKHESNWDAPVLLTSAIENTGVVEVWDMLQDYLKFVKENGYFIKRRTSQSSYWMYESINDQLKTSFYENEGVKAAINEMIQKVYNNEISSFVAASNLLDIYFKKG